MKLRPLQIAAAGVLVLGPALVLTGGDAPPPKFDIVPTEQRNPAVLLGAKLSTPAPAPVLPAEIKSPFHPPDFDRPAEGEGPRTAGGAAGPAPVTGARAVLNLAEPALRANVIGTIQLGNAQPMLQLRSQNGRTQNLRVGQSFFITIENVQHALELVSIEGKNYTLRYQDQQLTLSTALSSSSSSPASPQTGKSQ